MQCVMNQAVTFEMKVNVQLLPAGAYDTACERNSSKHLQDAKLSSILATPVSWRCFSAQQQLKRSRKGPELGLFHIDDTTVIL